MNVNDQVEVGVLPVGWETVPLRKVVSKLADGSHNPPTKQETGFPMLSARNIENNQIVFDDFRYISAVDFEKEHARTKIKTADVLLTIVGTIGRSAVVPADSKPFAVQRSVAVMTPDSVLPKYLMYQLQAPFIQHHFESVARGTAQKGVYLKVLGNTPIRVAPPDQQKLIVFEIEKQFSRLDEAVAGLKRIKANLKRYKAAVLRAAVEGKLTEEWRKAHPNVESGAQLLKRILVERKKKWEEKNPGKKYKEPVAPVTSNLPELPEGWVWATMPQLGELNRGKSKHRPRDDKKLYGGRYPFIQTGDVRKSRGAITEYSQTYNELGLRQSRLWPAGTLCITIAANIAETGILKFAACFPDSIVGFLIEGDETITQYVEYFIRTARENLERFAPATAQKNINLEVLKAVAVPLPPFTEQEKIVTEVNRRLSLVGKVEDQVDANLKRTGHLQRSILERAFTGSALLER